MPITDIRPTTIESTASGLGELDGEAFAIAVFPGDDSPVLGPGSPDLPDSVDVFAALDVAKAKGKAGEAVAVPGPEGRVLLVGVGDGSPRDYRRAGAALARKARGLERVVSAVTATAGDAGLRAFIEGATLASYAWWISKPAKAPLGTLVLALTGDDRDDAVAAGHGVARAGWLGRDLVHTPSNIKSPQWLADRAAEVADDAGLSVRIWDEKALVDGGFGGILGVGMGSDRPPRLIQLGYTPSDTVPERHIVLVGKGITFDTGGLSLKPRTSMVPMKTDMSGGAVVIAVLSALRAMKCQVRVTGLIPAAENMPGASAQRPSDVIRQYDGTTVEVRNTDAEGRLVLADAMAYAVANLEPSALIDIATLTGAATVGLGRWHAPMYATSDDLAAQLAEAGEAAGERLWRMPLVDDYRFALESDIADVSHVETSKVGGGSITAALFLERFAGGVPWVHLDIAGTGRADAAKDEIVKGGTAFGVRTLLYWLTSE
ncbi:MAG TPA: leucyl aminopeptidase [Jiangellaceae bacterium]